MAACRNVRQESTPGIIFRSSPDMEEVGVLPDSCQPPTVGVIGHGSFLWSHFGATGTTTQYRLSVISLGLSSSQAAWRRARNSL